MADWRHASSAAAMESMEIVYLAKEGNATAVRRRLKAGDSPDTVDETRTTALAWAVTARQVEVVKVLLSAGARANLADMGGLNPLHVASRLGNLKILRLLLNAKALVNTQSYIDGLTALHFACSNGHEEAMKLLLQHGALHLLGINRQNHLPMEIAVANGHDDCALAIMMWHAKDRGRRIPSREELHSREDLHAFFVDASPPLSLHFLVAAGDLNGVRAKLKDGCSPDDRDCSGMTALAVCAVTNCAEMMALLLAASADVNLTDGAGYTALHAGCYFDRHKCIKQLIDARASVNVAGLEGYTPVLLRLARPPDMVGALEGMQSFVEMPVASSKMCQTVGQLLAARANLNAALYDKSTALHLGCFYGHMKAVELLLSHGADINTTCKQYSGSKPEKPVEVARRVGHKDCVRLLVKAAVDASQRQKPAAAPKQAARPRSIVELVQAGDAEGVRKRLREGDDPDTVVQPRKAKNQLQRTLLSLACELGHEAVVKVLLARGASLKLDGSSSSELLVCSVKSSVAITRALIKARAMVNERSTPGFKGGTPLLAATLTGSVEVVAELIRAKADVNLMGSGSDTNPLSFPPVLAACATKPILAIGVNETEVPDIELRVAECVRLLLAKRADITANCINGLPPLLSCCIAGYHHIIGHLLSARADINAHSASNAATDKLAIRHGSTALHLACCDEGAPKCVEVLLAAKADVSAVDERGSTPLYVSCSYDNHQCAALLLQAGAADDATGVKGYTPMWECFNPGYSECVAELIAHTDRAARLYNRCHTMKNSTAQTDAGEQWAVSGVADRSRNLLVASLHYEDLFDEDLFVGGKKLLEDVARAALGQIDCMRPIIEHQLAVRAEDSDDDDDAERTYAFPPPVDLDAYAEACRLPPAEETEDEREARFQRERFFGL